MEKRFATVSTEPSVLALSTTTTLQSGFEVLAKNDAEAFLEDFFAVPVNNDNIG